MPRRNAAPKRDILPDPLFHSPMLAKFMNIVMRSGKKSLAEKVVYGALDIVLERRVRDAQAKGSDDSDDEGGEGGGSDGINLAKIKGGIRDSEMARKAALELFEQALEAVTPSVEVKSRRVGGSTYQVPVEIRAPRQRALAMRWLVEYSAARGEKTMISRLANEVLDALEGRGGAIKKREDVHRMAKANQAFAHYRW